MEEIARAHIVVAGRVQGVCYRAAAQKEAERLGLGGWAHNLADGTVELVAEGDKAKVERFVAWCKHGPPLASVEKCDSRFEEYKGEFPDFSIREFGF